LDEYVQSINRRKPVPAKENAKQKEGELLQNRI
jgi:hypothetical protein